MKIDSDFRKHINNLRFKVERVYHREPNARSYTEEPLIILEDSESKQIMITGYNDFLFRKVKDTYNVRLKVAKDLVMFLNYVFIDMYNKYKIQCAFELTLNHANDFLEDYAMGKVGWKKKNNKSVQLVEYSIKRFYRYLVSRNIVKTIPIETLYGQYCFDYINTKREINYKVASISTYFLNHMLMVTEREYPLMVLGLVLQAYGGFRIGEIVNLTTDRIKISKVEKKPIAMYIDLTRRTVMREDGKITGYIKVAREQGIHPSNLDVIYKAYTNHMFLLEGRDNPSNNLFINKNSKAMTHTNYRRCFNRILRLTVEMLEKDPSTTAANELDFIKSHRISPHSLRHFFSQDLVQNKGVTTQELALYRGDGNEESAQPYLRSHPDIKKIRKLSQERVFKRRK